MATKAILKVLTSLRIDCALTDMLLLSHISNVPVYGKNGRSILRVDALILLTKITKKTKIKKIFVILDWV